MKFKLLSVVVGTPACVAHCPFCVSGEAMGKSNLKHPEVNWRNLDIAANLANRSGVDTVMLTSRGEPTLFPEEISQYLAHLKKHNFPLIELQTNGILLASKKEFYRKYLQEWYDNGLTTIAVSVVSEKPELNSKIYMQGNADYINLEDLIEYLHSFKFSVRLTSVACKDMMDTPDRVLSFIRFAKKNKVEQVTIRPLNKEFRRESAKIWTEKNELSEENKAEIRKALEAQGTKLLDIGTIGSIYDIEGQNVCLSLPLNKNIRNESLENARQLIFFQDGSIRYEWEKEGAVIL